MEESILEGRNSFSVLLLGIVFNPQKKQILVTRRYGKDEKWGFPESALLLSASRKIEDLLKKEVSKNTGYEVEILGPVFSSIHPEKKNIIQIHYLCEIVGGEEKKNPIELKWINPNESGKYLALEPELEEYLVSLI